MDAILHLYGTHSVELMLVKPARRAADPRPILRVIGREMLDSERRLFESGGASGDAPWKALKPSTIKRKRGDARPLIRTGHEMFSLSSEASSDNLFRVTKAYVLIGSRAPAVPYQRSGTKNMAEREPLQFRLAQEERWVAMLSNFILNG